MAEAPASPNVTVSVVSHGQGKLVAQLLTELTRCPGIAEIIVTQNIPEPEIACPEALGGRVRFLRNATPLGFAANHNQAFRQCTQPFYVVLNPDIGLNDADPLPGLLACIEQPDRALVVPVVRNPDGRMEDSVRRFPTPLGLLAKLLRISDGRYGDLGQDPRAVDWAAGMFMLFRSDDFRAIGGFDAGFFLYYEDVDICARLWKSGRRVIACPGVSVIHDAQRASHRNLKYLKWHLSSMSRYFLKHAGRLPRTG